MKFTQLPSDDPTSYTTEELTKFINESWIELQQLRKIDPDKASNLDTKIKVCRKELSERKKLNIQQPKGQQFLWPDSLTVEEFLAQTPDDPDRWLWEDCLPVKTSSILVAKPKTGKSTFAANLSLAVSRGVSFLNRGVQQGSVLYVYLDGPKDEIKDIFMNFGLRVSDDIRLFASSSAPGDGEAAVKWVLEQMDKYKFKLIVIDPIQSFFQFKDLKYEEIYPKMAPMQAAAEKYNCHIQYTHHAGKGGGDRDDLDSFIGSQAFRAIAYTMIHMKRLAPDSRQRILRSDQRAGRNFDEVAISDGGDRWIEKIGNVEDAWIENKRPLITDFLKENPGVMEKEIMMAIEGSRTIISKALRRMLKEGAVERMGIPHSRTEPLRYYMAGDLVVQTQTVATKTGELFKVAKK